MKSLKYTLLSVLVVTAAMAYAFRFELAGTPWFWVTLGVPYAALAALALYRLWDDGTLVDVLAPRWGDFSLGFLTAALLLLSSWGARAILAPAGSPRLAWLFRIYAQVGDPDVVQKSVVYTTVLLLIVICEELVWRSLVLDELAQRFGSRRAWPLAALCYGLTALPTLYVLQVPTAGPNPLLVTAALGCGIVWSFLASIRGRLVPVIIAHGVFTYFSLVQFRWPG
jgi:membrane protease YdiL (CAAX protease family)